MGRYVMILAIDGRFMIVSVVQVAVWYRNTLASDANDLGPTPGGTLKLDTGYHPFVSR